MPLRLLLATLFLGSAFALAQPPQPTLAFKGHTDPIYTVTLSPDGKTLATGSFDKTIRLWNPVTGQELRILAGKQGHTNQVLQVAFSPKGDLLASGGSDNTLKIWDIASNIPAKTFAHEAPITRVSLTPDGKTLAVSAANNTIKTWTLPDGKAGPNLTGGKWASFGNSPAHLASIGTDRVLKYWALPAGTTTSSQGTTSDEVAGLVVHPGNNTTYLMTKTGWLSTYPVPLTAAKALLALPVSVSGLSLSADGQFLFVIHPDKSARVVNASNGQQTQLFGNLSSDVKAVAFAPNNQGYAVGTADGKAHLFGSDGKLKLALNTGEKALNTLIHHPSQATVLTAGPDGTVKVWAVPAAAPKAGTPDPKPTATIKVGTPVNLMTILPNGQLLTATDKVLKLWDIASQKEVKAFPAFPASVQTFSVSRDGTTLAISLGKAVQLLNLADGKLPPLPEQPAVVNSLSFNADRTKLVLGLADNTAKVLEVATGQTLQFSTATGPIVGVAFHPSQPTFLVASADKSLSIQTLQTVKQATDPTLGKLLTINNTGSHLFTAGNGKGLGIWNSASLAKERTLDLDGPIRAVAQSKNGQLLAVSYGGTPNITVLNFADGALVGSFKPSAHVTGIAFHPLTATLFASLENNTVQSWSIPYDVGQPLPNEFGKPLQTFPHPASITDFTITPDGQSLITGAADNQARVWKIISDLPSKNIPHPNLVDCLAFDKTGGQIVSGCHDGVLRIIDVTKAAITKTINAHTQPQANPIYAVMWSPDGKQVISASFDKTIKIWDVEKASLVREIKAGFDRFPPEEKHTKYTPAIIGALGGSWLNAPPDTGHRDQVFTLSLSPDGKLLASGSSDRTVKVWDMASGQLLRDFPNPTFKAPPAGLQPASHPGFVHQVRFNASGTKLISVGTAPRGQGYLAIWNVADGKLLGGYDLPVGPIYSFDLLENGVILGCGAKQRFQSESEAVLIPLPVK